MDFKLIKALHEHKGVMKNLMQFYIYDFSEYIKYDVEEDGSFSAYQNLEDYWKEENKRFPYLLEKNGKYAGFILVKFIESAERNYFSIAEFFIMRKYRWQGIGRAAAKQVFNLYKGQWQIFQKESNKPAYLFWNKIINEYTKGKFTEYSANGKRIQNFEN